MQRSFYFLTALFTSLVHSKLNRNNETVNCLEALHDVFPRCIPYYPVRRDFYTNKLVERGRIGQIGGLRRRPQNKLSYQVNLKDFKRALQCAPNEPELDRIKGASSLTNLIPPRKAIIEIICAWAETGCKPWSECRKHVRRYKRSYFFDPLADSKFTTSPFQVKLLRVIDGRLYFDWPWGRDRFENIPNFHIIDVVLKKVSDIGDSAFFMGEEVTYLPWNIPFPAFSNSPAFSGGEMPWPWIVPFMTELDDYFRDGPHGDPNYYARKMRKINPKSWSRKSDKAIFYGSLTHSRNVFFDILQIRTDLFEGHWTEGPEHNPWNPMSLEPVLMGNVWKKKYNASTPPGYYSTILKSYIRDGIKYRPSDYKYLVIMMGLDGRSNADRLSRFLADTGSVVLMQQSPYKYHFSSRLKPWVHYVPISYSTTDIIEKLEWLRENDHIGRKIAQNAKNFGLSYLRFEDTLCYAATALHHLSVLVNGTDALETFDPIDIMTESQ